MHQQQQYQQRQADFVPYSNNFSNNPHAFSNNFLQSDINQYSFAQNNANNNNSFSMNRSLNREIRYRNLVKIASENQEILYRIKNKRSEYSTDKLLQSSEMQERMALNISKFKRSPSKIHRKRIASAKPLNLRSESTINHNAYNTTEDVEVKTERKDESGVYDNSQVYDMIQSYKDQRNENKSNHPGAATRTSFRQFRSMKSAPYAPNHANLIYSVNRLARQQGYYSPYEPRQARGIVRNGDDQLQTTDGAFDQEIDFKSRTQIYKDQINIGPNPCIVEVSKGQREVYIVVYSIVDDKTFRLILNEQQSVKVFSKINYQFELLPNILHIQNSAMVLTLEDHNPTPQSQQNGEQVDSTNNQNSNQVESSEVAVNQNYLEQEFQQDDAEEFNDRAQSAIEVVEEESPLKKRVASVNDNQQHVQETATAQKKIESQNSQSQIKQQQQQSHQQTPQVDEKIDHEEEEEEEEDNVPYEYIEGEEF